MVESGRGDASIQAFFSPTPTPSPTKTLSASQPSSDTLIGDGFTEEEVKEALKPKLPEPWRPTAAHVECDIRDLLPGSQAVSFMGRVANVFDVMTTPKTPRSAKGCLKLCIKDDGGAITVGAPMVCYPFTKRQTGRISEYLDDPHNGENGTLSNSNASLFASLFPERDRSCHLMIHDDSDDGITCNPPLGYRQGRPLNGLMTLQNFIDGGYDVVDAKILVVVKSIGAKKKVIRKDESSTENVNLQVHDDTAEATLGLWGTSALSPFGTTSHSDSNTINPEVVTFKQGWKAGETVLLIQAPGWKIGRDTYLSLITSTIVDVDPPIPDTEWLRRWSLRLKCRAAINPPFPQGVFDYEAVESGPVRCLFTIAELDEAARATPAETFQGYLSLLIMEVKLLDCQKRHMLLSNECCNMPIYANATMATCKGCDKEVLLRLNPRILGQVIDETAAISCGKLLFSDRAWRDLLGRGPEDLLKLGYEELKYLSDRLMFCRITIMFGWSGDESKAGGRICVMDVRA